MGVPKLGVPKLVQRESLHVFEISVGAHYNPLALLQAFQDLNIARVTPT